MTDLTTGIIVDIKYNAENVDMVIVQYSVNKTVFVLKEHIHYVCNEDNTEIAPVIGEITTGKRVRVEYDTNNPADARLLDNVKSI